MTDGVDKCNSCETELIPLTEDISEILQERRQIPYNTDEDRDGKIIMPDEICPKCEGFEAYLEKKN